MPDRSALGMFVRVGTDIGVVVGLPESEGIPEDHYAVWYGQRSPDGVTPLARIVPIEYCLPMAKHDLYH